MTLHITEYICFLERRQSKKYVFDIIGNKSNSISGSVCSLSLSADCMEAQRRVSLAQCAPFLLIGRHLVWQLGDAAVS